MGPCCFPRACGPEAGEPEKPPWAAALSVPQFPSYPFSPTLLSPRRARGVPVRAHPGSGWEPAPARSGPKRPPRRAQERRRWRGQARWAPAVQGLGRGRAARRGLGPRAGPRDPPSCPRAESRPRLPPFLATRGPFRPRPLTWRGLAPGREKKGEAFTERTCCGKGSVVCTFMGGALTLPSCVSG